MNNMVDNLFELDQIARDSIKYYRKKRFLYNELKNLKGKHFKAIVGPRGSGKTILIKQLSALFKNSIYISADTLEPKEDLFHLIKKLNENYGIKNFFIDEIHFNENYQKHLKNIYDFLNVNIYFTSSVSISLIESSYDLSRRIKLYYLYPFSFREFIYFKLNVKLPLLKPNELFSENPKGYIRYGYLFEDYLKGGNYPFTLEEKHGGELFSNILKKVIYNDMAILGNLGFKELHEVENILKFIGNSPAEGISYSSIAKNTGITKYKAIKYVELLKKSFILNIVFPKGTNVLKEPKILMRVPYRLLYKDFESALSSLKEDFFVDSLVSAGIEHYYLKSKRGKKIPDYLVVSDNDEIIIEVGGKGKGMAQFKGIDNSKRKLILSYPYIEGKNRRPLFLAGFFY